MDKLGLIAGGGALPIAVAQACANIGRPLFVIRLKGMADDSLTAFDGVELPIEQFGKGVDALRKAQCVAVCMTGVVKRPDFASLRPDLKGLAIMPGVVAAARNGDDALMRHFVEQFEKEGFRVEGATDVTGALLLREGALGKIKPTADQLADVAKAMQVVHAIGALDVGQGAVVCDGLVLAVEAQEGTDAMLARVAGLPEPLRGTPAKPRGALAKIPKTTQERRMDLPTIGVQTIESCAAAGLSGVAGEAGAMVVLDRDRVIAKANELGLFVWGAAPDAQA
jgi:UDP-2,3-diacylglucosamine hydrolase